MQSSEDPDINTAYGRQVVLGIAVTSASISLLASLVVLVSYFFILWYQASMVNRVSLRLIVFSCLCNVVFSAMAMATAGMTDTSTACKVIIYFVIATDVMSVTCLSMIGLNLVMILIIRVAHPQKMEKYYYVFIALMAVIALVPPLGSKSPSATPTGRSCW
ncbi:hypothetical protein BJV82DRAFT_669009 [Fennellomyces sp. T-0311]|nr:hypothetical protein BJV82DRAFT_669009 [Fennellomyces sp. T-0311]